MADSRITLSGLASGIDTGSIIDGLVKANSAPISIMQRQSAQFKDAVSTINDIGTKVGALKTAALALSAANDVGSFTATSTSSAIAASASATALPGSYDIQVNSLAVEQRTYSAAVTSRTAALQQSGSISILGEVINVSGTDTLDTIVGKINSAGIRAQATVLYDGSKYRMQLRGLDAGTANSLSIVESGTNLDLIGPGGNPSSYSVGFSDTNSAINQTGSLDISIGGNPPTNLAIDPGDSLDEIVANINSLGIGARASTFFDGSKYRLQIQSTTPGAGNEVSIAENGTTLAIGGPSGQALSGKTAQAASDASITVDGFTITSPTNQVTGVVPGLTLGLTQKTTTPVTVTVASDNSAFKDKVKAVVDGFNKIVGAVHFAAGSGTVKASNPSLAGDSALRGVLQRISGYLGTTFANDGNFSRLGQVGVSINRDGTLKLDETKLSTAFTTDPDSVKKLFARPVGATEGGVMTGLAELADKLTQSGIGSVPARAEMFKKRADGLDKKALQEQDRLDRYADKLRKQFTNMETVYSKNQALGNQLAGISKLNTSG